MQQNRLQQECTSLDCRLYSVQTRDRTVHHEMNHRIWYTHLLVLCFPRLNIRLDNLNPLLCRGVTCTFFRGWGGECVSLFLEGVIYPLVLFVHHTVPLLLVCVVYSNCSSCKYFVNILL